VLFVILGLEPDNPNITNIVKSFLTKINDFTDNQKKRHKKSLSAKDE